MNKLQKAREKLWDQMKGHGGVCPCCDRWTKIAPRPLNKKMVSGLYWIFENSKAGHYIDVATTGPRWLVSSNQHTTLKHWGLLESRSNDDPKKKCSGWWRVTKKGRRVLFGEPIEKFAIIYNDTCYGHKEPMVTLDEIVDYFDYEEIMAATVND